MVVERRACGRDPPGGREEPAGGTHPSALRAPWNMDREECMWAGPTLGGKNKLNLELYYRCLNLATLLL